LKKWIGKRTNRGKKAVAMFLFVVRKKGRFELKRTQRAGCERDTVSN